MLFKSATFSVRLTLFICLFFVFFPSKWRPFYCTFSGKTVKINNFLEPLTLVYNVAKLLINIVWRVYIIYLEVSRWRHFQKDNSLLSLMTLGRLLYLFWVRFKRFKTYLLYLPTYSPHICHWVLKGWPFATQWLIYLPWRRTLHKFNQLSNCDFHVF